MANFPGASPAIPTSVGSTTLAVQAGIGHAALHNLIAGEILALANKIGTGASTPTNGLFLMGSGVGTSGWRAGTKSDVGLDQVDNTSDAAKNAAAVILTNKTLITPTVASFINAAHDHSDAAGGGKITGSTAITAGTVTRTELATIIRKVMLGIQRHTSSSTAAMFPNGASNTIILLYTISDDYVSGDLTVNILIRGDTTGNVLMQRTSYRFRQDTAYLAMDASVNTVIAMGTGSKLYQFTCAASNFQIGDTVRFDVSRIGADASDTSPGDEDVDATWVEYTGRA